MIRRWTRFITPHVVTTQRFITAGAVSRRAGDGTRRRHTHVSLPLNDANRYGGRAARLRHIGRINKYCGPKWQKDERLPLYNIDVWAAQQTTRKKWKGRDWDVVEVPFECAPKTHQRVIPELYTDLPIAGSLPDGRQCNIRDHVVDVEEFQHVLFPGAPSPPYPPLRRCSEDERRNALGSFFSGLY